MQGCPEFPQVFQGVVRNSRANPLVTRRSPMQWRATFRGFPELESPWPHGPKIPKVKISFRSGCVRPLARVGFRNQVMEGREPRARSPCMRARDAPHEEFRGTSARTLRNTPWTTRPRIDLAAYQICLSQLVARVWSNAASSRSACCCCLAPCLQPTQPKSREPGCVSSLPFARTDSKGGPGTRVSYIPWPTHFRAG